VNVSAKLVVASHPITSDTLSGSVSGTLLADRTYYFSSDITINAKDTLLMQPGSKLISMGDGKTTATSPQITCNGTFISLGTADANNYITVPDDRRTFAHASGDSFDRPRPDIADCEDAGAAGLESPMGRLAGHDEAAVIQRDSAIDPGRVGFGTDEQEEKARGDVPLLGRIGRSKMHSLEQAVASPVEFRDRGLSVDLDVRCCRDAVDQIPRHRCIETVAADSQVDSPGMR